MDYLIFDTETQAIAINNAIFEIAKVLYASKGFPVDEDGIISSRDGVFDDAEVKTTSWYTPQQRLDDKWIVLHPRHSAAADTVLEDGTMGIVALMAQLPPQLEETEDTSWWPEQTL